MSQQVATAPMPLFDRLCGSAAAAVQGTLLDGAGLQQSIARDLARLLNTRSPLGLRAFLQEPLTVLDYGLPDFCALSAGSADDLALLRAVVLRALERFEPRLQRVQLQLQQSEREPRRVELRIAAAVTMSRRQYRVSFEAQLGLAGAHSAAGRT